MAAAVTLALVGGWTGPAAGATASLSTATRPLAGPLPLAGDPVRDGQWQLKTLNVSAAWQYAQGDGVTVAVLDSGVDARHPDLAGQVLPGLDLVDPAGDGRSDPVGHGTTVSALIAGRGDDTAGVVGIAPKARILPVRVLDADNRYDDALTVAKGVRWAVDHGARVVNLSLGGNGTSAALAAALDYAFAKDVVVVACTGNIGASDSAEVWYPAREPGVLAVAGLERTDTQLWSGSITGEQTVVAAPATDLLGARPGGYWKVQGTSFAAPMVTATAALIRSRWPTMSAAEVINRIIRTARDLGVPGRDDEYGYGVVDPTAALTADVPAVSRNPLDTAPPPGVAGFGSAPTKAAALADASHPVRHASKAAAAVPGSASGSPTSSDSWLIAVAALAVGTVSALLAARRFREPH